MKTNKIIIAILISALLGTAVSMLLVREHYFAPIMKITQNKNDRLHSFARSVCGGSKNTKIQTGCEKIALSPYSMVFDIPLANLGVVFFLMMTFFSIVSIISKDQKQLLYKYILFWLLIFGSGVDISLLGISLIKIGTICTLCFVTYIFVWFSAIALGLNLFKNGNNPSEFSQIIDTFKELGSNERTRVIVISILIGAVSIAGAYTLKEYMINNSDTVAKKIQEKRITAILAQFKKMPSKVINTKGMHLIGNPDAPITIVKFSDFMCPACGKASKVLDNLLRFNADKVKIYFANYPLDNNCNITMKRQLHDGACLLAKGSICADDAGKFHQYYQSTFSKHLHKANLSTVYAIAREIGILNENFKKCMASASADKALQKEMTEADNLKVNSTPSIYINGKEYKYRALESLLKKIVDQELNTMDRKKTMQRYKAGQ